jgi:hypothetical protein
VEKEAQKCEVLLLFPKKTFWSKQSPNGQKFAQSGHPACLWITRMQKQFTENVYCLTYFKSQTHVYLTNKNTEFNFEKKSTYLILSCSQQSLLITNRYLTFRLAQTSFFLLPAMLSQVCHKATCIRQTWLFALCRQLNPSYKVRMGCSDTPSSPRLYVFLINNKN